jgi:predicted CXXCH cytochrome family protein
VPHKSAAPDDPNASWGVPLWSTVRSTGDTLPTYDLYNSPTFHDLGTDITQPDGPSKLCLGCHDGSYIGLQGSSKAAYVFGAGDLKNSHPISFTYDSALASRHPKHSLNDPAVTNSGLGGTIQTDLLDSHGKLQCTSCHDVHTSGKGTYMLRYDYDTTLKTDNVICRVCHNK